MNLKNQIITVLLIFSIASQVWAFYLLDQNKKPQRIRRPAV